MSKKKSMVSEKEIVNKINTTEKDSSVTKKRSREEAEKFRNGLSHKKRFEIMERDGFRCQYCGRNPKEDITVQLQVDHKIPVEAGGSHNDENLITSCFDCNNGKGNTTLKEDIDVKDLSGLVDRDLLLEIMQSGNRDKIKKYFESDEAEENRQLLYKYWMFKDSTDCPKDCKSCITICDSYLRCFEEMSKALFSGMVPAVVDETRGKLTPFTIESKELTVSNNRMACNRCYISDRCPKFKLNSDCAYDFTLDMDFSDTESALKYLINLQKERVVRNAFFERIDGGVADKNVTSELEILTSLIEQYQNRNSSSFEMNIKSKGNAGGSILQSIFGDMFKDKKEKNIEEHKSNRELPEKKNTEEAEVIVEKKEE